MLFGEELRRVREEQELSCSQMAAKMFMVPSTLSRLERGLARPKMHHARAADQALDVGDRFQNLLRLEMGLAHAGLDETQSNIAHILAVTTDGKVIPVHANRRQFLAGVGAVAVSAAISEQLAPLGLSGSPGGFAQIVTSSWPATRLSQADPSYGADWHVAMPGGRSMRGSRLDVQIYPATATPGKERISADMLDHARAADFVRRPTRGLLVGHTERDNTLYAVDARAARNTIVAGGELSFPTAYELDDFTYGILWEVANLDDSLQSDDQELAGAIANLSAYESLSASAVSREAAPGLDQVSHMWLGSDFCARHILRTMPELPDVPSFWTREQAGEEASTWLLFEHKSQYLRRTTEQLGSPSIRAFCIPEEAVRVSPRWERVMLFLAVSLMESFGIQARVTADPEYATVEGFVAAPGKKAIIANWVGGDSLWHVDTTTRTSTIRELTDIIGAVGAHSIIEAPTAQGRLQAFAAFLELDWAWLRRRCAAMSRHGAAGLIRPRSRLISADGVDAACAFVAACSTEPYYLQS